MKKAIYDRRDQIGWVTLNRPSPDQRSRSLGERDVIVR